MLKNMLKNMFDYKNEVCSFHSWLFLTEWVIGTYPYKKGMIYTIPLSELFLW